MYKIILLFVLLFAGFQNRAQTPVYLYFASHNEMNDATYHGLNYANPVHFAMMRNYVKAVCDTIITYNAKYVLQVESNFILGCLANDNAATSDTDILQWADATPQIDVEPHNHFKPTTGLGYNPYNYADLAHLLDSCGLPAPRKLMGGFIWRNFTTPPISEDWTIWQTPQPGHTFTNYYWQPQFIWGGGSPNHIQDFQAFGVWQPSAPTVAGFGIHNPAQPLICIGGGCNDDFLLTDTTNVTLLGNRVINLVNYLNANTWPDTAFFSFKIMMNFRNFTSPDFATKAGQLLLRLRPYAETGKFQWKTVNEVYASWQNLHSDPNDNFVFPCENIPISNATPPPCNFVTSVTGQTNVCTDNTVTYSTPFMAGSTYLWTVEGGIIVSGQGTNIIEVQWNNGIAGTVSLIHSVE